MLRAAGNDLLTRGCWQAKKKEKKERKGKEEEEEEEEEGEEEEENKQTHVLTKKITAISAPFTLFFRVHQKLQGMGYCSIPSTPGLQGSGALGPRGPGASNNACWATRLNSFGKMVYGGD